MSLALDHPARIRGAAARSRAFMRAGSDSVETRRVSDAIRVLLRNSRAATEHAWLRAIARLVSDARPDIAEQLVAHLGVRPLESTSPLEGMSIGEVGVVYEALTALTDHRSRRDQGQYFTPDDVAAYLAGTSRRFPPGVWLDPCCGVGNLAWHLAQEMDDPDDFITNRLCLIDIDPIALRTAAALLVTTFASWNDNEALSRLVERSYCRNFLAPGDVPHHDFVIVNPPYGSTARIDRFRTAEARENYAYFLERIATDSQGFIAITPASFLGAAKYQSLRTLLEELSGGDVIVFDNVPDTCFRGYKYGSTNTSKTNFVRAAITISSPDHDGWRSTPILRWAARSRARMWCTAHTFLMPLRKGPAGEWAKVMPGTEQVWDALIAAPHRLSDLTCSGPTAYALDVASTPRYYVSASKRSLKRGSKHTLYFASQADRERAYILLNSSLPYWWWRCLDGGITLPIRNLMSLPIPDALTNSAEIVELLERSEEEHVVTKLNAGRLNENIRHPRDVIEIVDESLLSDIHYSFALVYSADMFQGELPAIITGD